MAIALASTVCSIRMERRMRSAGKVVAWRRFDVQPEEVWAALGADPQGVLAPNGPFGSVQAFAQGPWTVDPPSRARRLSAGCDQRLRIERAIGDRSRLVVETLVWRSGWFAGLAARMAASAAGRAAVTALQAVALPGDGKAGLRAHPLPPAMAGHGEDALGTLLAPATSR